MLRLRPRTTIALVIGSAFLLVGVLLAVLRVARDSDDDPNGRMVRVGDHELFLTCRGSGSPTVVMDAGLGANHTSWDRVVEVLDRASTAKTQVCAYDRAGRGKSDGDPGGSHSIGQAGDQLRALLFAAGIQPPYVLVAHSIAGLIHRHYALSYPADVTGLVMVDTVPDDWDRYLGQSLFIGGGETLMYLDEVERLKKDDLGARPTVVIQAEKTTYLDSSDSFRDYWLRSQRALAALSTNSILVTATGSDHLVPDTRPELVARAIDLVVESARTGTPLPPCTASGLPQAKGGC